MGSFRFARPVIAVAMSTLLLAATCAVQSRLKEYKRMLDPELGRATQEQVARSWGPPERRETIGASEFWTYRRSFGVQGSATPLFGSVYSNARETYDQVVMEFRNGVLFSWRAYVQR